MFYNAADPVDEQGEQSHEQDSDDEHGGEAEIDTRGDQDAESAAVA